MKLVSHKDPVTLNPRLVRGVNGTFIDLDNIKFSKFPGGELSPLIPYSQIHVAPKVSQTDNYFCRIESSDDLMALMILSEGLDINQLFIPCMPYARQDRPYNNLGFRVFNTFETFSKIVNLINCKSILTLDPHSDVCLNRFNKPIIKGSISELYKGIEFFYPTHKIVCIPDLGARKKLDYVSSELGTSLYIQFDKSRGSDNSIRSYRVIDHNLDNFSTSGDIELIIFDDILDGGATMIELARSLNDFIEDHPEIFIHAMKITKRIVVTHGIFSNLENLRVLMDNEFHICTSDSHTGALKALEHFQNAEVETPGSIKILHLVGNNYEEVLC